MQVTLTSERMIHRGDVITALGRLIALIPVLLIALLGPSSGFDFGRRPLLMVIFCMTAVDAIPVVMLILKVYPDWAAWTFLLLDSLFCLLILYLGGSGMFFYCFVPVLAASVRFHWWVGLLDAFVLVAGHVLILSIRASPFVADAVRSVRLGGLVLGAGWEPIRQVFAGTWNQEISVFVVSVLGGLLIESVKKEPPLNANEVQTRQQEMSHWRAAADRAHAIYRMAGTLSATLNPNKILDAVLEIGAAGFTEMSEGSGPSGGRLASAVFLFGQEGLYVAASRGLGPHEADLTVPGEQGVLCEILSSSGPKVWGALAKDPELASFAAFRRCQSAVCAPLCASYESYGVVIFASSMPDVFGKDHIDMLGAVSSQASVALTNAHLYQDLQREKENILSIEEDARLKLARNLHDGPTQSISAIAMRLNYVRLLLDRNPERVREELFKLENIARNTTKDVRTLLFTLRPLVLDTQGLKAAVEQLVERLFVVEGEGDGEHKLVVDLDIEDIDGQLSPNTQAVAWSVIDESLTNVRKHANAQNVAIKMGIRDGFFVAEISDDGKGFDVEATMDIYDQRSSYGLLGLQERAALVNGRTTIESVPGKGTQVTLIVPLSSEVD